MKDATDNGGDFNLFYHEPGDLRNVWQPFDLTTQIHARPVLRLKAEKEEGHAQEEVSPRRDYHQAA